MRSVRAQEEVGFLRGQSPLGGDMAQENKRGRGVGKSVVPAKTWQSAAEILFQPEIEDEIAEGKRFLLRPEGPSKLQGIDPGAKAVEGKRTQEPSFGSGAMGDEPAVMEEATKFRPEVGQARRSGEILRTDTVDLSRRPSDRLVREEKAREGFRNLEPAHQRDADLDGHFGSSPSHARAFEIQGGKRDLGNGHVVLVR